MISEICQRPLRSLLIVEDNPLIRADLERVARESTFFDSIEVAENGHHALLRLREGLAMTPPALPTVVLTDVYMPDLNGIELALELQRNPSWRSICRVVISGQDEPDQRNAACFAGCEAFFKKPPAGRSLAPLMSDLTAAADKHLANLGAFAEADETAVPRAWGFLRWGEAAGPLAIAV